MARVFISYRQVLPDLAIARSLYHRLRELDHDVFFDRESIKPGAEWEREIQERLRETEWFVALVSSSYFYSDYVEKELRIAEELRLAGKLQGIIPINVAFDGLASTESGKAVAALQAIKWRQAADTDTVIEAAVQRLPAPHVLVKGMRPFEVTDARAFLSLGREAELDAFLARLQARPAPLLLLHGTSGSGKTSFLRAGVMAKLLAEGKPVRLVREPRPFTWELLAPGEERLVFIDQFEQLLAHLGRHPEACEAFVTGLERSLVETPEATWVLSLRDEYRTAFETLLPSWAERSTRFALLSFAPTAAARVLAELLESARVEYTPAFLEPLCQELAEGTPPTVKPALLQLLAQRCREQGLTLTPASWARMREGSGSLFESHLRERVLGRLHGPRARLHATRTLRALTAGDLKAEPRRLEEVARRAAVSEPAAKSVLESAATSSARVVHVEADADARESYQLVHDLFAGAIEGVHQDESRRWQLWGRSALAVLLAGLLVLVMVLGAREAEQRRLAVKLHGEAEQRLREAEALSRRVLAGKLVAQARPLMEWKPQTALLLLIEALRATHDHGEPALPEAEQELRQALSRIGGLPLRFGPSRKVQQVAVGEEWLAVSFSRGGRVCPIEASSSERDCIALEDDVHDFIGLSAGDRWLITRGERGGLRLWTLEAGKVVPAPAALAPSKPGQPIVLSEDGTRLAVAGADGRVRFRDLTTAEAREQVLGPGTPLAVEALALSPDGRWVAASVENVGPPASSRILVWDAAAAGSPPRSSFLPRPQARVASLSISADGRWLRTWGLKTRHWKELDGPPPYYNQLWYLRTPSSPVHAPGPGADELGAVPAVFSRDGRWLATYADTVGVRLFFLDPEASEAEPLKLLRTEDSGISQSLRFTADGRWLIGLARGGMKVQVWPLGELRATSLDSLERKPRVLLGGEPTARGGFGLSLDGRWLVAQDSDEGLRRWTLEGSRPGAHPLELGKPIQQLEQSADPRKPLALSRWLVTAPPVPKLWDLAHLGTVKPIPLPREGEPEWSSVQVSPDGQWLAGTRDGVLLMLQPGRETRHRMWRPLQEGAPSRSRFSPDSQWFIASTPEQRPRFWKLHQDGAVEQAWSLPGPNAEVRDFHFVPGHQEVLLLRGGRLLRLALAGSSVGQAHVLDCDGNSLRHFRISPDGRWVLGEVSNQTAEAPDAEVQGCLWNLQEQRQAPRRLRGVGPLLDAAFTPDSRELLVLSQSTRWWTLHLQDGRPPGEAVELHRWSRHGAGWSPAPEPLLPVSDEEVTAGVLSSLSFSPDGAWLSLDYCGQDMDCVVPLRGPGPLRVSRFAAQGRRYFSPDGRWMYRHGLLLELRLPAPVPRFFTATGRRLELLSPPAFSGDGRWLATWTLMGDIELWPLQGGAAPPQPTTIQERAFSRALAFTPDDQWLISVETADIASSREDYPENVRLMAYPVAAGPLLAMAGRTAGRNLDWDEWRDALGDIPYRKTIATLPVGRFVSAAGLRELQERRRKGEDADATLKRYEALVSQAMEYGRPSEAHWLCMTGSMEGFARTVLPLCELAISLDPEDVSLRQGRAIARAQLGDPSGALDDLRTWMSGGERYSNEARRQQVGRWMTELSAGHNPFASLSAEQVLFEPQHADQQP